MQTLTRLGIDFGRERKVLFVRNGLIQVADFTHHFSEVDVIEPLKAPNLFNLADA